MCGYKLLLLTYKTLNGLSPSYLKDLLMPKPLRRASLRSNDSNLLDIPRSSIPTYGDRAFCVAGPMLWNKLPTPLRSAETLAQFKQKLKNVLFKKAYDI